MDKPFAGDFDAMVNRRAIRVAATFNRTHYFIDKGQERRLTWTTETSARLRGRQVSPDERFQLAMARQ